MQDFKPLVSQHVDAVRRSQDYRLLLETASRVCNSGGELPEKLLADVADTVLRSIARDLSACSPGNNVVIFHMAVINEQA